MTHDIVVCPYLALQGSRFIISYVYPLVLARFQQDEFYWYPQDFPLTDLVAHFMPGSYRA